MGTGSLRGLRCAHGAPTLHSLSTVSQLISRLFVQGIRKLIDPGVLYRCHRGIYSYLPAQGFRDPQTDFLQFHSIWVPVENVCGVLDTQLSKKTIIATLVTDLVLLFTMLFGLLRLRRHGTMFGLGQLLWNQVGN
jgi:hypothetical protein